MHIILLPVKVLHVVIGDGMRGHLPVIFQDSSQLSLSPRVRHVGKSADRWYKKEG